MEIDITKKIDEYVFAIDESSCVECGQCRRFCPVPGVITIDDDYQHVINPETCIGCGVCVAFCPAEPETIFKVPRAEAISREWIKAKRRCTWRTRFHFETHPIMGPLTLEARISLRDKQKVEIVADNAAQYDGGE